MKSVTCSKCGWVHFSVSSEYVYNWMREWVEHWIKFDQKTRESYGMSEGPPGPDIYLNCQRCGNSYKDFHDITPEEDKKAYGSTVGPILNRDEIL